MSERLLKPQQELFLSYYTNPKSETFANATKSGLKAGYSQEYSENITALMPDWLSESIGDLKLLRKAEKVMNQTLDYVPINEEGKIDTSLLSIQNKTAQFVAERLNKSKYSTRQEVTGKDGEALVQTNPIVEDLANKLNEIYKGTDSGSNGTETSSLGVETSSQE